MNENITELFSRIFSTEELMREFAKIDDLEELYKFSISVKGGYTKEEFYNFIYELLNSVNDSELTLDELSESDSQLVSGGTGERIKKLVASGLVATSMFSTVPEMFATNTNIDSNLSTSQSLETTTKEKSTSEKIKDFWKNHKGKIMVGGAILSAALAGVSFIAYKAPKWKDDYDKEKNQRKDTVKIYEDNVNDLRTKLESEYENKKKLKIHKELLIAEKDLKAIEQHNKTDIGSKIKVLANVIAGGGVIASGLSSMGSLFSSGITKFSNKAKEFKNITSFFQTVSNFINMLDYNIKLAKDQISKADVNIEEKKKTFENDLLDIKGQDEALKKVRTFFYGILMDREVAKSSKKPTGANIIVLNGPAGVGKTLTANALARGLSNGEYYSMNGPNELDGTQDLKKDLFGSASSGFYGYDFDNPKRGISSYLKSHPDGVVIINEYDKIKKKRPTDTHPLDELLRGVLDEGFVIADGQKVDCSKVTFIFTTNETDASLQGRVKVENGRLVDPDLASDTTGSRTVILHDKSFLTRFKTVSFNNLNEDAYYEIAKNELAPLKDFLATNKDYKIQLDIPDEIYRDIAKYTVGMQEGARPIKDLNRSLGSAVSLFVGDLQSKNPSMSLNGLKLKTSFKFEGRNADFKLEIVS